MYVDSEVAEKVDRLALGFAAHGHDKYGISKQRLGEFFSLLAFFYRHWHRVECTGIDNVPDTGRAVLVGNHGGGIAVDGAMVLTSLILDKRPPRLAHGMAEKFLQRWPFASPWLARVGQFTGLPDHAERLLRDDRVLMVFPEGARGTGKLYRDRYKLVRFGTGFMRLAMATGSPIVPLGFIGGEEAVPTMFHIRRFARLVGAPYIPVPPQLLPIPLPVPCRLIYGEPMHFEGDGDESDDVIASNVAAVKARVAQLVQRGRTERGDFS